MSKESCRENQSTKTCMGSLDSREFTIIFRLHIKKHKFFLKLDISENMIFHYYIRA